MYGDPGAPSEVLWSSKCCAAVECLHGVNIVLVGATGHGKSSTGNLLLGDEVFETSDDFSSETLECKGCRFEMSSDFFPYGPISGLLLDTPGFLDTRMTGDDHLKLWQPFASMVDGGVHVFLFVARADTRWATEVQQSLQSFETNCGPNVWQHTLLVLTHCKME